MKKAKRLRKPRQSTSKTRPRLQKNHLTNLKNQKNNYSCHRRTLILVKCNRSSEEICKLIANAASVVMYLKQNASQKNANVASTFTCAQAQKNNLIFPLIQLFLYTI